MFHVRIGRRSGCLPGGLCGRLDISHTSSILTSLLIHCFTSVMNPIIALSQTATVRDKLRERLYHSLAMAVGMCLTWSRSTRRITLLEAFLGNFSHTKTRWTLNSGFRCVRMATWQSL